MEIKPLDEKAWDIKEGDFVVSYYALEEYWDDWEPELEEYNEKALDSLIEQANTLNKFPVLIGVVTKCKYEKYFRVFYLICDEHGVVLHADSSYQPFNTNHYWFKYDFEKLGIDKEWLKYNLENTIKEKENELKNFNYFKNAFYKNKKGG